MHAAAARVPQRRAFTYVDERGERTITVLGPKLIPSGDDGSLPWEELGRCDAVYFVSGDVAAVRAARRSRVLVATARDLADAAAGRGGSRCPRRKRGGRRASATSRASSTRRRRRSSRPRARSAAGSGPGGPFRAAPLLAPIEDAYGCGDAFAAGLTFALAAGRSMDEAVEVAARCGAAVLTGRGPYAGQLGGGDFTL